MYGNQNGWFKFWTFEVFLFAKLKRTTNNPLTQGKMRFRPSEVKLGVQLVIFTPDINPLSVET